MKRLSRTAKRSLGILASLALLCSVLFSAYPATLTADAAGLSTLAATVIVTTEADSGPGSLQEAVDQAVDGDVIGFASNVSTITLESSLEYFGGGSITLLGSTDADGTPQVTIQRAAAGNFDFVYNDGVEVLSVYGLAFSGSGNNTGGAISSFGDVVAENCTFTENATDHEGSAILSYGSITAENCAFTGNTANYSGGAVFSFSDVVVKNCTFTDNVSDYEGGAVFSYDTVVAENCTFTGNTADYDGGAIFTNSGLTAANCTFTENTAKCGGAIYAHSTSTISGCTFTENCAEGGEYDWCCGGAIYINTMVPSRSLIEYDDLSFVLTVIDSDFTENLAGDDGGAISGPYTGDFSASGAFSISGSTFSGNSAGYDGGAISSTNRVVAENCVFTENDTRYSGGALSSLYTDLSDCSFYNNTAHDEFDSYGGAIASYGIVIAESSTFYGNSALYGGAVNCTSALLANCFLTENTTTDQAESAALSAYDAFLFQTTVTNNNGNGICIDDSTYAARSLDENGDHVPDLWMYNSIVSGNMAEQILGIQSGTALPVKGGDNLIEGVDGVTHAAIFGSNTIDANGWLAPLNSGIAAATATAISDISAANLTQYFTLYYGNYDVDGNILAALKADIANVARGADVTYGALEVIPVSDDPDPTPIDPDPDPTPIDPDPDPTPIDPVTTPTGTNNNIPSTGDTNAFNWLTLLFPVAGLGLYALRKRTVK